MKIPILKSQVSSFSRGHGMDNEKRGIEQLFGFIIILLAFLIIPTVLFGGASDKKQERNSESQGDYILRVKESLISLKAKDASFKEILEEIGRRMNIEVAANIPKEEKITIEFDMMPLREAIKRFRKSYAYVTDTEKKEGKITKIVVVPEGLGKGLSNKFEYDPQPSIQEFKYNPQPSIQKKK